VLSSTRAKMERKKSLRRPKRSRERLIAYLRTTGIKSANKLEKLRKDGDPVVYDYKREFGSWQAAKEAAFGVDVSVEDCTCTEHGAEYLLKIMLEFGIKTRAEYLELRRRKPSVVPSVNHVIRHWGSFRAMKAYVRSYSLIDILNEYLKLYRRHGGPPSFRVCRSAGLDISKLVTDLGGKGELDALAASVEVKLCENGSRDN